MRRLFACCLLLTGCAVPKKTLEKAPPAHPPAAAVSPQGELEMIVFIPQTDDAVGAWIKWFAKYPNLRMVIAVSPRFQHLTMDPTLKSQIQALVKSGRLELGLQIPNAPILPLLVDTNSAKDAPPQQTP